MSAVLLVMLLSGPRPGVKTPGVKIPIERLEASAVFEVPGSPDWIAIDEAVWISNEPRNTVTRLDPRRIEATRP